LGWRLSRIGAGCFRGYCRDWIGLDRGAAVPTQHQSIAKDFEVEGLEVEGFERWVVWDREIGSVGAKWWIPVRRLL
jgi:hypothetical protein